MSCQADKAIEELIRRELQRRLQKFNQLMLQGSRRMAQAQGAQTPGSIAKGALGASAQLAASEVIRPLARALTPRPSPAAHAAAANKYLSNLHRTLTRRGVDSAKVEEIVEGEACLIHVANSLASGELMHHAIQKVG
jgi:hypothetical protein